MFRKTAAVAMGIGLLVCWVGSAVPAYAQEEDEGSEFAYGKVAEVSTDKITITEFGVGDEESNTVYMVNDKTTLENIDALSALSAGDEVYIDYVVEGANNVAVNIYKVTAEDDQEDMGDLDGTDISQESYNEQREEN